ncbi:SH3 domain-containing protein [Zavarzinia sp.]|uniref:SH3 domain-containing protein n=1 Tax=Zavarzinia sp. TaxID=2027920 RepID=UPI00356807B9
MSARAVSLKKHLPAVFAIGLLVAPGIAACVPDSSAPGGTIAANDPCSSQRSQLTAIGDYFNQAMIEGAVAGAALGALGGALIGGDWQSAAIGAGVGAVGGAVAGYYSAKAEANTDRTQLVGGVYKDLYSENQQIDRTTAAFRGVRACRTAEANGIRADYKAGRISADEARGRLAAVKTKFEWEVQYAEEVGGKMNERGQEYTYAATEISHFEPGTRTPTTAAASGANYQVTGPVLTRVASKSTRVRELPSTSSRQIGGLKAGEIVEAREVTGVSGGWMRVRLADGTPGFVSASLLVTQDRYRGDTAAVASRAEPQTAAPPPQSAGGVVQLAETNQIKQRALADDVSESRTMLSSTTFELDQPLTLAPLGAVDPAA